MTGLPAKKKMDADHSDDDNDDMDVAADGIPVTAEDLVKSRTRWWDRNNTKFSFMVVTVAAKKEYINTGNVRCAPCNLTLAIERYTRNLSAHGRSLR